MLRTLWGVIALSMVAAMLAQVWTGLEAARRQSAQLTVEHGQRIATILERAGAGATRRDQALQAYFDEHRLRRIELLDAQGAPLFRRVAPSAPPTPGLAWMAMVLPVSDGQEMLLPPRPGSSGGLRLRLVPPAVNIAEPIWALLLPFAAVLAPLLLAVWAWSAWSLRGARRHVAELGLRNTQPRSSSSGPESGSRPASDALAPATQPTTAAPSLLLEQMRELVRLEADMLVQAKELETLRRAAHVDALTGLLTRRSALARLEQALEGDAALPAASLLLLRLRDLASMNRRSGHDVGNQVLQTVAETLSALVEGREGAICGRLNGSDLVLLVPGRGQAQPVAELLLSKLRTALIAIDPMASLAIGAVDLVGRVKLKQALALADEALASAESGPRFAVSALGNGNQVAFGDSVWQQRLTDALAQRRTVLAAFPVVAPDGRLLHLDCPMRVQFEEGGAYESAWRWLAPAARGRFSAAIDLRAVQLALEAITHDGQARCINVSAQSLASSEFMVNVASELEFAALAARKLWIDLPESQALDQPVLVLEAARRWGSLGVQVALEHAGEHLGRIESLGGLGLHCVRIDSRFLRGITGPESTAVRKHLQSMVRTVHQAGMTISAEGVATSGDLVLLWSMGFDAATGPAVARRNQSMSPQ